MHAFLFMVDCIQYREIWNLLILVFYLHKADCDTLFCHITVEHLEIKSDKILFILKVSLNFGCFHL